MSRLKFEKRNFVNNIFLILKGIAMGTANKVPGVSGGVVAFVGGFYEEFIYSLQKINFNAFKFFINFRFKSFWKYINGSFLGLLILGMLISYFSVSKLLDYFLERNELEVWALFFGMIIGSVIYISKNYENWNFKNIVFLLLGTLVGVAISLLKPAGENDNLWFVFVCGIIGVSGMTLPGLSGSFILILLGNYILLLVDSVNVLYDTLFYLFKNDFSFLEDQEHMRLLHVLGVFSLGSFFGLVSLSHFLGYVLKKYKNETFAIIIGFITGSLGVVWPWKNKIYKLSEEGSVLLDPKGNMVLDYYKRYFPDLTINTAIVLCWIILGVVLVLYIERLGKQNRK